MPVFVRAMFHSGLADVACVDPSAALHVARNGSGVATPTSTSVAHCMMPSWCVRDRRRPAAYPQMFGEVAPSRRAGDQEPPKTATPQPQSELVTVIGFKGYDGADAAGLANNVGLGLYDIVKHANYPGFHSMPSDHLACNKAVWDGMPEKHQKIIKVAMESLALRTAMQTEVLNNEAAAMLTEKGITLYAWSPEDRQKFRDAAQASWPEFATTPEAKALVESHIAFLKKLGLVK